MVRTPPKYALKFLRWFCREDYVEEIEGDLVQLYQSRGASVLFPTLRFWITVIQYFRPWFLKSISRRHLNPNSMFQHNLTVAFRNARKYKSAFLINLTGLSTGLASVLLIWLWVQDEMSVDKFHANDKQLYRVWKNAPLSDGGIATYDYTPGLMGRMMAEDFPEVETYTSVVQRNPGIISYQGKRFKAQSEHASVDFFKIFSFPLLQGNVNQVLNDQRSVVISEPLAIKLFGTTDHVVGKIVEWNWWNKFSGPYTITGIFQSLPTNSTLQFDLVFSFDLYLDTTKDTYWGSNNAWTYVLLKEGTDINAFNEKVRNYSRHKYEQLHDKEGVKWEGDVFLKLYSDNYLYGEFKNGKQTGGRIRYVRLFTTVAAFILAIACINFMNLSTARASRRMKEIGIKKTVGAARYSIIFQYLTESTLVVFLSLFIALGTVWLILPYFSQMTGKDIHLSFNIEQVLVIAGICLFTGLLAGSYPALYLSGLRPVSVLKGIRTSAFGEAMVRKTLVVFQFCVTIILIVSVIVVYKQIDYIQTKDLGYNRDNILIVPNDGELEKSLPTFLTELKRIPGIEGASSMGGNLIGEHSGGGGIDWEGKVNGIDFGGYYLDYGMTELLGLQMKSGRTFSLPNNADRGKVIFNETAIRMMNLKDPVGKTVTMWGQKREIIGIVKDFHYESLYSPVGPFFLVCTEDNQSTYVRIKSGYEMDVIGKIQKLYHQFNPGLNFEYRFVDQDFEKLYAAENRVAALSRYFAVIAILISCLGLFGLAAFTAERRTKEIGIRKILGATAMNVLLLLSSDFMKLIILAIVIALPVSFYMGNSWLSTFAYRIDLQWWYFIVAGLIAIVIAGSTILSQIFRTSNVNPVQSIKSE